MASSPSERDHLARLAGAELRPLGWIRAASNGALLVALDGDESALAVYKPDEGERPLWDFPYGTLARRETAAFALSDWLGWELVPATVYREGPAGWGSVQRFVAHDPRRHYFTLVEEGAWDEALRRMALFDLLANNADRKASHVLAGEEGLRGCDHGLCFHAEPKLRTVIWDFGGQPIPEDARADVRRLLDALEADAEPAPRLAELLAGEEIAALTRRARAVLGMSTLPDPPKDRRAYPWPFL